MPKVHNLKDSEKHFTVRNKSNGKAEVIIYGSIGASWFEEGITAKAVSDELKKLDDSVKDITVRINSLGGDVFEGITIYNRLKQHKAKVTVFVDGIAASIASIIALSGDEVIMSEGSLLMIHLPWTYTAGNRKDLEDTIDRLADVEQQLLAIYSKKTKLDRIELKSMLEKETWMDASQAIDLGFADKTDSQAIPIAASALKNAVWLRKPSDKIRTTTAEAKAKLTELKSKIEGVLARKK
jgi:ATP-dependent protease ClpP protease subunit